MYLENHPNVVSYLKNIIQIFVYVSSPAEKLFSFARIIQYSSRRRLSDSVFEKLIFLKGNVFF